MDRVGGGEEGEREGGKGIGRLWQKVLKSFGKKTQTLKPRSLGNHSRR
jgi:hypothetical protein